MDIDSRAPLIAKKGTLINAPISQVWKTQSDIESWPKWQKEISFTKLEGELREGTIFKWKAMGMDITSELQKVVENEIIGWSGRSIGMNAIHIWRFEREGDKTRVITEESLSGWFPRLIKLFKPDFLEQSLSKALQTLKNQAESQKNN